MELLNKNDVNFYADNSYDPSGIIFKYNERIFRVIHQHKQKEVCDFLDSPLFSQLQDQKLLVKTWITEDIRLEGFDLILEHERLDLITIPCEWSFDMLKAACLLFLDIYELSTKHGYHLSDGHGFNISFVGISPIYIDLGSFQKNVHYAGLNESISLMYHPLRLWSEGQFLTAHSLLMGMEHNRFSPRVYLNDVLSRANGKISTVEITFAQRVMRKLKLKKHDRKSLITGAIYRTINELRQSIISFKLVQSQSLWGHYHDMIREENQMDRFHSIIAIIEKENTICSVIDLAGNQAYFSTLLTKNVDRIQRVVSSDCDLEAIHKAALYLEERRSEEKYLNKITPCILNMMYPTPLSQLVTTSKADLVIAMAVTHHLLLTDNWDIDLIFEQISQYSKGFVLIEFMPVGLWDRVSEVLPAIPDWYTEAWFQEHFMKHYDLLEKQQTERNRILFFGKLKKG